MTVLWLKTCQNDGLGVGDLVKIMFLLRFTPYIFKLLLSKLIGENKWYKKNSKIELFFVIKEIQTTFEGLF